MMKHEQNSRFVLCETSRGTLGVEVVAQDILRVFLGRETQNYFSKAVEADRHEDCAFTVTEEGDTLVIATPALRREVDARHVVRRVLPVSATNARRQQLYNDHQCLPDLCEL